jgi:importin subunit alpha-1
LINYINQFKSENYDSQYIGLVGLRKILSNSNTVQEVINHGLVYDFIKYLDHQLPEYIFEAVWCLINIASGTAEQTNSIISKGGVEKLINLIDYPIVEIQEQAIWAVGNIAGTSIKIRDMIIDRDGLKRIVKSLSLAETENLLKQSIWAISNFCRFRSPPGYEHLKPCLDHVIGSLYKLDDNESIIDACAVLSYFSESYKPSIKQLIDSNCIPKLISYLEYLILTLADR